MLSISVPGTIVSAVPLSTVKALFSEYLVNDSTGPSVRVPASVP